MLAATQCWVLFTLKWILFRRTWSRREFWGYVFLSVLLFFGVLLSAAISITLYFLALYVSREKSPELLLALLNGAIILYLFFYVWGVLMDLQRADLVDFRKMLLLPIPLPVVYFLNFLVSVVSPIMLFAIPGLIGLFAGLYPAYGAPVFWAGIPLVLLFMVMMSAWAYYFRGRLAIIMENKRHRRMALVILPLCFVAMGQVPALLSHMALTNGDQALGRDILAALLPHLLLINSLLPVFWPACGLWALLTGGSVFSVLGLMLGLFLCTVLGLRFGYVSTLRHYMGVYESTTGVRKNGAASRRPPPVAIPVTAHHLPMLADDTAALTLAFYHSFARHPHVRMLIIMPLCLGLFFLFMYRAGAYGGYLAGEKAWIPMASLAWPFFNFSLFLFNIFGVDAPSFHGLMLFPVQRRKLLAAKNLALAPFVLGMSLFFIVVGALLVQAPVRVVVLSLTLTAHLYLLFCVVGNFLSVRFPYRINRDALRQPTRRIRMLVVGLTSTLLVAVMILPASYCMFMEKAGAGQQQFLLRNGGLISAFLLFGLTLAVYLRSITFFGDQFTAREHLIYARINGDRE